MWGRMGPILLPPASLQPCRGAIHAPRSQHPGINSSHAYRSTDLPCCPAVVPFVHSGMEDVLPRGASLPKPGQKVRVLVGQPISFEDLRLRTQVRIWL